MKSPTLLRGFVLLASEGRKFWSWYGGMMRQGCMRFGVGTAALLWSTLIAAEIPDPQPKQAAIPAWVKPVAIPSPDPARVDEPIQVLLLEGQTKLDKKGSETYFEMVLKPQTVAGLQGFSTIALPWNVSQSDLTIHAIEALRAGKSIDLIKNNPFTILRREANLESSQLDGVRTVVLPAKGIELGDIIRISATYQEIPSEFRPKPDDLSKWFPPFPVALMDRRVLVSTDTPIKWQVRGRAPKPVVTTTAEGTEYRFIARSIEPTKFPKHMRDLDKADEVQYSAYQDWGEVVANHVALYRAARTLAPNSPLAAEADKIAASTVDPQKRMMAALRLSQERVRYIAMLLGDGAYRPVGAEETWEARYGDCKAKSGMLLALLDRLGVKADAMYVGASAGDALAERLPSLQTFDHVIVKAEIGGKAYYLDPTDYGHRVPRDVAGSFFKFGLPLVAGATLEKLPAIIPTEPTIDSELIWDGSQGVVSDVPFRVRLTLRGPMAVLARVKKAAAGTATDFEKFLKDYVPTIDNKKLTIVSQKDDADTGDLVVEFTGKSDALWDEYEGRKGIRFAFGHDASNWKTDFDRKEGDFRESRVVLNPTYWEREIETFILPSAKGFSVDDAQPINRTIAGSRIWRDVRMDGNRITAVTNFRHLEADIAAEEARAAEDEIEEISDNWAYIVGPRSITAPKNR